MILSSAFILGFLGSAHCIGMCGPLWFSFLSFNDKPSNKIIHFLLSGLGRIISYMIIGLIFSTIGYGFSLIGYQSYLSIIIGVFFILLIIRPGILKLNPIKKVLYVLVSFLKKVFSEQINNHKYVSVFLLGLINGFLPCGNVYLATGMSLALGSLFNGTIFMLVFGIGTLPAMFLVLYINKSITTSFFNTLIKYKKIFLLLYAILLLLRGLNLDIPYISPSIMVEENKIQTNCH